MISGENEDLEVNTAASTTLNIDSKVENESIQPQQPKQPQQNLSKLEALSKDDLIKLVKKQLLNQKELKRQLEASKNENEANANQVRELSSKIAIFEGKQDGTSMLIVELEDYKNASVKMKKELQDCKEKLAEKEALIEELSQHIATLHEEKAETNEQLRQKGIESTELKQSIDEKSNLIAENSKEISSLLIQLNDSRQQMQQEINFLNESLLTNSAELKNEQRSSSARFAEERAEFVFKSSKVSDVPTNVNSTLSQVVDNSGTDNVSFDGEIDQLLELLKQRNVLISQLRTKCSFLEEEVKNSQEYSKTLLEELNALHDSISQIRRQSQSERQRTIGEFEQKLKKEEMLRITLENDLKLITGREIVAIKNLKELKIECERLESELEEAKRKLTTSDNSPPLPQHFIQKQQRKTSISIQKKNINQQQKQFPKPLNLTTKIPTDFSQNQQSSFEDEFIGRNAVIGDEDNATMNSESLTDSLDDLQSMLREAEIEPNSEIPSFNVSELPSDALSLNGGLQRIYYSHEEYNLIIQQLNSCRELLSESEEINVRLNEQNNLLKEEIRRLERNQHRAKQLENEVCSEYFKNIVLKFLTPPRVFDERAQLLPVLQTILHLDEREMEMVRMNITAQAPQGNQDQKGEGSSFAVWVIYLEFPGHYIM
uniref:GRIP domain-containing protein n=1 Tax=Meloidogyne javanica TaxID=6303 RepID=A0A915M8Q5_MELJA